MSSFLRSTGLLLLVCACAFGQDEKNPQSMGSATGGYHAPVLDAKARPITAGGTSDSAPLVFSDIAVKAGLAKFQHRMGTADKKYIIEVRGREWQYSTTTMM